MNIFKNSIMLLGLISTSLYLNATVSLTGPFSEKSKKLVEYVKNPLEKIAPEYQKHADAIAFLRMINGKENFTPNFVEFNAPQNIKILTAPDNTAVIEALVQIITEKKPTFAKVHFETYYDLEGDEDKFILAKVALITNSAHLFDQILENSSQVLQEQLFVMILHEADLNKVDIAEQFLRKIKNPNANDKDRLGFTVLAIAAGFKHSPELTHYILQLKPAVNLIMQKLYNDPNQQDQTVLDLVDTALTHEKDAETLNNLKKIHQLLLEAGAKKASELKPKFWKVDLD